jgi:hypothetical protein
MMGRRPVPLPHRVGEYIVTAAFVS